MYIFGCLEAFGVRLGLDFGGVQNDPKKHPKNAFGAQGSLGGLQGTLWEAFLAQVGLILKLPGVNFRTLPPFRRGVRTAF